VIGQHGKSDAPRVRAASTEALPAEASGVEPVQVEGRRGIGLPDEGSPSGVVAHLRHRAW
jgi:hypothetical protein